jgi:hypothetical protein
MILLILTLFMFLITLFGKPVFQAASDGLKNFVDTIRNWFEILFRRKNEQKDTPHKRAARPKQARSTQHHGFWERFIHRH